MKFLCAVLIAFFLAPCFVSAQQSDAERAKAFIQTGKRLPIAERILKGILEEAPYDGVVPHVLVALAEIEEARGERAKALTLLDEVVDRIGTQPYGRISVIETREHAVQLRQKILSH